MVDHVITPVMVHNTLIEVDNLLRTEFPEAFVDPAKGRGGAFFLMVPRSGEYAVLGTMVKECPPDRMVKRSAFAAEKAERLIAHLELGHVLSYQSRDESLDQYPGAVAGRMYIYSLSGYDADMDELLSLMVAYRVGDMSRTDVKQALSLRDEPNRHLAGASHELMARLFPGW